MNVKLIDIYREPDNYEKYVKYLFTLLSQRKDWQNISHSKMPMFIQHYKFVDSKPYRNWYVVSVDDILVGATYMTNQYEIGIHLTDDNQGKKIGPKVVKLLMERFIHRPLFANINPKNARSIAMFIKLGFMFAGGIYNERDTGYKQVTYALKSVSDEPEPQPPQPC